MKFLATYDFPEHALGGSSTRMDWHMALTGTAEEWYA
jgi:hypothetical protein